MYSWFYFKAHKQALEKQGACLRAVHGREHCRFPSRMTTATTTQQNINSTNSIARLPLKTHRDKMKLLLSNWRCFFWWFIQSVMAKSISRHDCKWQLWLYSGYFDNMFDSCFYLVLMPISAASTIKQLINYPYLIKKKKFHTVYFILIKSVTLGRINWIWIRPDWYNTVSLN